MPIATNPAGHPLERYSLDLPFVLDSLQRAIDELHDNLEEGRISAPADLERLTHTMLVSVHRLRVCEGRDDIGRRCSPMELAHKTADISALSEASLRWTYPGHYTFHEHHAHAQQANGPALVQINHYAQLLAASNFLFREAKRADRFLQPKEHIRAVQDIVTTLAASIPCQPNSTSAQMLNLFSDETLT
jgi:hypothetical protein